MHFPYLLFFFASDVDRRCLEDEESVAQRTVETTPKIMWKISLPLKLLLLLLIRLLLLLLLLLLLPLPIAFALSALPCQVSF